MRILTFSPYYPPHTGGVENYVQELNENLALKNIEVFVVAPQLPSVAPAKEIRNHVHIFRFPAFEIIPNYPLPKIWRREFWDILKEIQQEQFDIVTSHTRFFLISSTLAFFYAKKLKLKWVHTEHGSDFVQLSNPFFSFCAKIYDYTLGKLTLFAADDIIAISQASANFVKKLAPQTKPVIIYRGFDFEKIDAIIPADINKQAPIILYFGRLISGKGVADLFKALSTLKTEDFACLIVGDGPEISKLQALQKKLDLEEKIQFLGQKTWPETISLVKAADIIVNPSYTEGLPTSLIEAAVCSKAIVATNVGGTSEIIKHEESGVLFASKDIVTLATTIQKLLTNPQERTQFGANARKHAFNMFDWKKSTQKFIEIFKK